MKALKTIGIVVGAVALVATGIGLAAAPGAAAAAAGSTGTFAGISAATWSTVGAVAGVTSGVLSLGTSLLTPSAGFGGGGNALQFQTNPNSGLPYAIGRTRMSGLKIAGKTAASPGWSQQDLLFFAALLSCAPADAIETFKADNVTIAFNGSTGAATTSGYVGWMAQKVALGETPQSAALSLSLNGSAFPGWTSAHKLSGMPHVAWALRYDSDGDHYQGGVPDPEWIGRWRLAYDPRKDSTYPGGSGSHRADDESTWEWTRNPGLQALAWTIGRFANGKKIAGIGAPIENIRVSDFVECANVNDANGWGCGGVEWTTSPKWDVLSRILQAGGAVPTKSGAMIGCRVMTPRVSIASITGADLLDELVDPATKPQRDRFNTARPRYASEAHGWEVITGSTITVADYVTADGRIRSKEIDLPLVQAEVGQAGFDGDLQAGQLATYAIVNSRERGPLEVTTGLAFIGVHTGDCITIDVPEQGYDALKVVVTGRTLDIANAAIRFTVETETDEKHAFALGESSTPPPAPTLSTPPAAVSVPDPGDWTVTAIALGDGQAGLRISGSIGDPVADTVRVGYSPAGASQWKDAAPLSGAAALTLDLGPLDSSTAWDVRLAYSAKGRAGDWLEISGVATGTNALLALIGDAARSGTVFPAASDSQADQIFIRTDLGNRYFIRNDADGWLYCGGVRLTCGGNPLYVPPWTEITDTRAIQAFNDAAIAVAQLSDLAADGIISASTEKRTAIRLYNKLIAEFSEASAKATALGEASSENATATASMAALNAYLASLGPFAWNNLDGDTDVVRSEWDDNWKSAEDDVAALVMAIQGRPGESPYLFDLAQSSVTIRRTYAGVIKAGELSRNIAATLRQGETDVLGSATITPTPSNGGLTVSYSAPNVVISGASASGYIDVVATIGGTPVGGTKRITVKFQDDPAPAESQTSGTKYPSGGAFSNTSYGSPAAATILLAANGSGQIYVDLSVEYVTDATTAPGLVSCEIAIAYRAAGGGSWSYAGAVAAGSSSVDVEGNVDPGYGSIEAELLSGLTAGAIYEIGAVIRKTGGPFANGGGWNGVLIARQS